MKKKIVLGLITLITMSFNIDIKKDNNSKQENYESLKKYVEKNNLQIDLEKTLFLKKKADFNNIAIFKEFNYYKKNINKFSIPDVFLFNNNSVLIDENALGGCIIDRPSNYYTEIFKKNKILINKNNNKQCNLEDLNQILYDYKGNLVFPFKKDKPCLIFIWAKNKTSFNSLNDYINYTVTSLKGSNKDIDFYFLNVDEYSFE